MFSYKILSIHKEQEKPIQFQTAPMASNVYRQMLPTMESVLTWLPNLVSFSTLY